MNTERSTDPVVRMANWKALSQERAARRFAVAVESLKQARASGDLWRISQADQAVSDAWDEVNRRFKL
jgi:hypothetical protein